ncbi:MAG: hypothetical protein EP344_19440 [Bacteroidetes bacterium]|nr:MAG: hypothetical protein EP344_19440 [Bacteroidota bacterium]
MTTGMFTDVRDGITYKTIEINGITWLAENLRFDVGEGSWVYNNDAHLEEKYGRMYTWEAAQKACLEGWRLPTDAEWKALAMAFGGYHDGETGKDVGDPAQSYNAMLENGASGFNAEMGGWRYSYGEFYNMGSGGGYWSADEKDDQYAWNFYFDAFKGYLARNGYNKLDANYCRCVKAG